MGMDIERRRTEAEAGSDRKPRLIEDGELPEFLLQDMNDVEEDEEEAQRIQQEELEMGRKRSRKDVTYHENLSEKDWLKAIGAEEEDSDYGVGGFKERRHQRKRKRNVAVMRRMTSLQRKRKRLAKNLRKR